MHRRLAKIQGGWFARLIDVKPGSCRLDPQTRPTFQRVEKPSMANRNLVVGEHTAVDICRQEADGILWTHSVVDAFRYKCTPAGDAGFETDDACIWPNAGQLLQSRAPNRRT